MILFQQPHLTLEYDEQYKCLSQHWNGYVKSVQFREGIEKSIDFFKQKNPVSLISNTRDMAVVSSEDSHWAATYATPILISNGLKYMAFIIPTNLFTHLSVDNFKSKTAGTLQMQYFDDLSRAREWLRQ
jgi:hypothetical protein